MAQENKTIQELVGTDKTVEHGVVLSSSPSALIKEYRQWLADNPNGIVAYRALGAKSFSIEAVEKGVIGNPFNWKNYGEEKATVMFYNWLHMGDSQGENDANNAFRDAVVAKLRSLPDNAPVLYYKDVGHPSHATILGYFIRNKDMLYDIAKANTVQQEPATKQSLNLTEVDTDTLRKAALFAAWETRDDNPYDFVVDLSRTELESFITTAFDKLNVEDKYIVNKILSNEPGYGEDFVSKLINGEKPYQPLIENFLFDELTVGADVLTRAMFYEMTSGMSNEQLNNIQDSVKKSVIKYYTEADKDAVSEESHQKMIDFVEKELHSWFRPWTRIAGKMESNLEILNMQEARGPVTIKDIETEARRVMADKDAQQYLGRELLGWVRNRCVDYGLDYTKIPEDLQYPGAVEDFKKQYPELVKGAKASVAEEKKIGAEQHDAPIVEVKKYEGVWARNDVQKDKDNLYIFTDNTDRDSGRGVVPRESQYYKKYSESGKDLHYPTVTSAVIRGLDNAMPVSTQRWYHDGAKGPSGRWNESDALEFTKVVGKEFSEIRKEIINRALQNNNPTPFKVFLPGGNDGFANGKISAITEERTPKLYAYLKAQEQSLDFTANLVNTVVAGLQPANDRIKDVAEAIAHSVAENGAFLSEELNKAFEDELKITLLRTMPSVSPAEDRAITAENQQRAASQGDEALQPKDLSALASYSPYQIKTILDDVPFPRRGADTEFDTANDYINEKLFAGWNRNMDSHQEKAYLLSLINELPAAVVETITDYARTAIPVQTNDVPQKSTIFNETPCDVYTLGLSTKKPDEMFAAVPPSTKVIIDIRKNPDRSFQSWYHSKEIEKAVTEKGYTYTHIPVDQDGAVNLIQQLINQNPSGVLIVDSSSQPEKSPRGLDLGPRLERSGIKVGHIRQGFDNDNKRWTAKLRIETQEALTNRLLGNKEIKNGSYKQIVFRQDGKPILTDGVVLRDKILRTTHDRNVVGHDNYNNPVEVDETKRPGLGEALFEAAKQAHFTLVFRGLVPNINEKMAMDAAKGNAAHIYIPEDDDKLTDINYARNIVYGSDGKHGIMEILNRSILKQTTASPDSFDKMNMTLQVEGSNEPRILCKPAVNGHVSDEELEQAGLKDNFAKMGGYDEGMIVTRESGVSIQAFQQFVKNCITLINSPEEKNILGETTTIEKDFSFKRIISTGDSGAGEAGILAAQSLGLQVKAQAPMGYTFTIDNGTLQGQKVKDEASYKNRFKLGLKNAISEDDLRLQIDHVHSAGIGIDTPGLTDRQILVLSELGFSNSDILTIQTQAVVNNIKIKEEPVMTDPDKYVMSSHQNLIDFLIDCQQGYGIGEGSLELVVSELTPETVIAAEKNVDKMVENYRRNGIGILTIANKYYPDQFRTFEGFDSSRTDYELSRNENGAYVYDKTVAVKEERPAILTFKGNIESIFMDKVTVTGNTYARANEIKTAKNIGEALAAERVAVVTSFRPLGHLSHSQPFINASETILGIDVDNVRSRPGKRYSVYGAPEDSPYFAATAAMDKGATHIVVSPNSLTNKADQDRIDRAIQSGGVVFSEAKFEEGFGDQTLIDRAGHLACALGGKAILLGSKDESYSQSPVSECRSALLGTVVVDTPVELGFEDMTEGSRKLIDMGIPTIKANASNIADYIDDIRTFSFEDAAELTTEKEKEVVSKKTEKEDIEMHVDNYQLWVVRRGQEQIFIVPSNYPDVRQTIIDAYGEDVVFAEDVTLAKRNLSEEVVDFFGESVRSFSGYKGTEPLHESVYRIPLFYAQGKIYSATNAPRNTAGLIRSQNSRIQNRKDFDDFKEMALKVQDKFLAAVYEGAEGEHRPIRFERAFYPVITEHSVEIYQGEALRAKVFIDDRGALKVTNYGNLSDDLTEYNYSKYIFPNDFDSEKLRSADSRATLSAALISFAARMESVLMSTPVEETEMFALATREQKEDIQQRLENKFLTLSEDNLDVAAGDILKGINDGLLVENSNQEYDKQEAVAAIVGESNRVIKQIKELLKAESVIDKRILDAENKRDAAYNQGYSVQEYEKMDQDIEDLQAEKSNILGGLTSSKQRYAILENIKEDMAVAEKVFLAKSSSLDSDKKLSLYVNGAKVEIIPSLINKKTKELAAKTITEVSKSHTERAKSFKESIEAIENHHASASEIGKMYDQMHSSKYGKAEKSEIKPESFNKGRYIVVRDGKEAYADENYNIRSDFFTSLGPWNGGWGLARQEDGKMNYVDPSGELIMDTWFNSRSQMTEKTFVIEVDGEYGITDESGKLFGGRLFDNAHTSIDGWCAVRAGLSDDEHAGKFNFINSSGKFLTKKWFDECSDFDGEGKATVKLGNKFHEIGTDGKILRKDIKVDLPKGQTLFNSGKGKGGRR